MKTTVRPILASILCLQLTACSWALLLPSTNRDSDKPSGSASTPAPPLVEKETKPAEPRRSDVLRRLYNTSTANHQAKLQIYNVERHFQRVIRKDCDGHITSDREETVKDPHFEIVLKAPDRRRFKSVFVFNDRTGDDKITEMPNRNWGLSVLLDPVTGNGKNEIKLKADVADAVYTFYMETDLNNVFVEYHYDCILKSVENGLDSAPSNRKTCLESKDKTIVHYPIQVIYKELHLGGALEVPTAPAICAEKARTKTP